MFIIAIIASFAGLFVIARKSGGGSGAASPGGPGTNTGLPDPGASAASMVGSVSAHLPLSTAITPYAGNGAKLSPGTTAGRLNQANRIALRGTGRVQQTIRRPLTQQVKTSNPATTPFDAAGTKAFIGGLASTSRNPSGFKI